MTKKYEAGELKSLVIQHRDSGKIAIACYGNQCDDFIISIEEKIEEGAPEVQGLWGKPLDNVEKC